MTKYQIDCLNFVFIHNLRQLKIGGNQFLKTWFAGDDGVYYDPIGDEIFIARRVGGTDARPIYWLDFGDEQKQGPLASGGFEYFLGAL